MYNTHDIQIWVVLLLGSTVLLSLLLLRRLLLQTVSLVRHATGPVKQAVCSQSSSSSSSSSSSVAPQPGSGLDREHTVLHWEFEKCITKQRIDQYLRFLFQARCSDTDCSCIFWTLRYSHRWHCHWGCSVLWCRGALPSTTSAATCWEAINISVRVSYTSCVTQKNLW
jgi:IS4 transposase